MTSRAAGRYRRALLKLSGESLKGHSHTGVDYSVVTYLAKLIQHVHKIGVEIGVVVGGGNIWRGRDAESAGMERTTADYAGMLAIIINALVVQSAVEQLGLATEILSAIDIRGVVAPHSTRNAVRHLQEGRVVIFAGGIGNPYMSTDTAAALRAIEIKAQVLLMAKNNVDGIYDLDPNIHADARKFDHLTYMEALGKRLQVMDSTALSLCMENQMPIVVFDVFADNALDRVLNGEHIGTLVSE